MANPNCVVRNSRRSMQLLDIFASSEPAVVAVRAQAWMEEGFTVRVTSYKIGPKKNPTIMHKVSKYQKKQPE